MARIFINFRNRDGQHAADTLHRELSARLGPDAVFRSSNSIPLGADYVTTLLEQAAGCAAMLAVVGPYWLDAAGADGGRRLENPEDWVRREIATALAAGRTVIPVLLDGLPPLSGEGLPDDLAALARCQYERLDARTTISDIERLEKKLRRILPGLSARRERPPAGVLPGFQQTNTAYNGGVINSPANGDVNIHGGQSGIRHEYHGGFSDGATRAALGEVVRLVEEHERELALNRQQSRQLWEAVYVLRRASQEGGLREPEVSRAATVVWTMLGSVLSSVAAGGIVEAFKVLVGR
ncbi:TIR domain-containing protein [Phytomonospora endophytica]|uniref:TIR domain-containing protein n=1 Tax=Phytomonospora endophytica TaxID=714109 RepID=A0A841FIH9_9ACTN|nr:TIR domain-containing protein [Phytomonospora endophytica]MBB6034763.1 hypothetical protein [Phytomonospora endophytica]GIG69034.1 hypothetical protein Pen01_53290 [Phytomonospora endophytica]